MFSIKQHLYHFHLIGQLSPSLTSDLKPHSYISNLHKLSTHFSGNINSQTSLAQIAVCNPSGMGRIQNKLLLIVML